MQSKTFSEVSVEPAQSMISDLARAQTLVDLLRRRSVEQPDRQSYTFLPEEANSIARTNRTDWSFTWERSNFRAKDAPYRLQVVLQGNRVGQR